MGQHKEQKEEYSGITFHMHHVRSITAAYGRLVIVPHYIQKPLVSH